MSQRNLEIVDFEFMPWRCYPGRFKTLHHQSWNVHTPIQGPSISCRRRMGTTRGRRGRGKQADTISLMYSVMMSSRTAADSGSGFGSSPKAYMSNLTVVRGRGGTESTVFLEEILFACDTSARMVSHSASEAWQVVGFAHTNFGNFLNFWWRKSSGV
jgi:hypothetical protein